MGFIIPSDWWRAPSISVVALSLFMLAVNFHPLMIIGKVSSLAVLVVLVWLCWSPMSLVK